VSSTAVTGAISMMAAEAVGNSVSEFQSGFSDSRSDSAARVSFKVSFVYCILKYSVTSFTHLS
jgi:hypothetical protein